MKRAWRDVRGLMPVCTGVVVLALLGAGLLPVPSASIPVSPANGHETAWHPYREQDSSGVWSICVSSASGVPIPPYINIDAATPIPASANNPPVGGAL